MTGASLRERQRLEVRAELQKIAVAMFIEQGFDNVSVTDVADRAGVVQRTFYRHFTTKEEAVLSLLDDFAPVVHAHVRNHPGGDAPWRVLLAAMTASAERRAQVSSDVMRMIFNTPKLTSAYFERQRHWAAMVANVLAERMSVDVDRDPRPILWATIAFEITTRVTYENVLLDPHPDPLERLEDHFRQTAELFNGQLP